MNLASRIGERLAFYLWTTDDAKAAAEAVEIASATVDETPADPPTWQYARAVATYANTLLVDDDFDVVREQAENALAAARAADAPWVQADALVTLGFLSNREGRNDEAIKLLTQAHKQAREAKVLGVELRAAYHLARAHLEHGDLKAGGAVAHEGTKRANQTGLGLAPYGTDVQHLHFQCHYADGKWDHAQEIADGFPVRVTSIPEASLSSMALFIDVARANPVVEERHAWIEPFLSAHGFDGFIARGLIAEHALWQGDTEEALAQARAALNLVYEPPWGFHPSAIRPAAVAMCALADRAVQARATGDDAAAAAAVTAAGELLQIAREGAAFPKRPKFILGPEGRGWLARAEAEYRRADGGNDPQAWQAVLDAFGPGYVYEICPHPVAAGRGAGRGGPPGRGGGAVAPGGADGGQARRPAAAPGARRPGPPGQDRGRRGARRRCGAGLADQPGTRGPPAHRRGPQQQGDRFRAVHRAEDGQRARVQHPGQARRRQPHRGGRHRAPRGPHPAARPTLRTLTSRRSRSAGTAQSRGTKAPLAGPAQRGASPARISPARSAASWGATAGLPTCGSQFRS